MYKKILPAAVFAAVALFLIFVGKPYLRQKNALKVVDTVLTYWEKGDLLLAMSYWEKANDSPPVYSLQSYKIGEKEISRKGGTYYAHISAVLYFPEGNHFPTEREWIFELNKTHHGWKIIGFHLKE